MEKLWLPKQIERMVAGKRFEKNKVGMSGSQVLVFDDMVLKIQARSEETENEVNACRWLGKRLPVPEILVYTTAGDTAYCLMSRMQGKMLCDPFYMDRPGLLLDLAARALEHLWTVDVADCLFDSTLDEKLRIAEQNVEAGHVDLTNTEPETFGEHGFSSPKELLEWLKAHRPPEDLVLTHGDFCLPNIFARGEQVTGYIDLGRMGIADRWQDVAICCRSLKDNFEGRYNGGRAYFGFSPELLLERLGIEENQEKLTYYILLDELF